MANAIRKVLVPWGAKLPTGPCVKVIPSSHHQICNHWIENNQQKRNDKKCSLNSVLFCHPGMFKIPMEGMDLLVPHGPRAPLGEFGGEELEVPHGLPSKAHPDPF